MRDRWRKLGSPQNFTQKKFVHKFFETLIVYKSNKNSILTTFLSLFSEHPIETELGIFNNIYNAYTEYLNKYCVDNKIENTNITDKIKLKIMTNILKLKFHKYPNVKTAILNTGLKKIIYFSKEDNFWGNGIDNKGKNYLGKLLTKIRNEYLHEH